jgi:hypothetical protein
MAFSVGPEGGPKFKIDRAKEHLEALYSALADQCRKPCGIARKDDLKQGLHFIKIDPPEIDMRIAVIAGDVAGCLRASLDHLAWQLALMGLGRKRKPNRHTKFPIMARRDDEEFLCAVREMPERAQTIVESFQPYHGAVYKDSLLWKLNRLCNIDKHWTIALHSDSFYFQWPKSPPNGIPLYFADQNMVAVPLAFKGYVDLDPKITYEVIFGDYVGKFGVTLGDLKQMHDSISTKILPAFSCFFT